MSVKIKNADLFSAPEDIIGHQVNCQGVMGAGVAKQIRSKYPKVYDEYLSLCRDKSPHNLLGYCHFVAIGEADENNFVRRYIANLFAQLNYGRKNLRYTDYVSLEQALRKLKEVAKYHQFTVALPYNIGCGLAGGEWSVVEKIIEDVFSDYEVTLYRI